MDPLKTLCLVSRNYKLRLALHSQPPLYRRERGGWECNEREVRERNHPGRFFPFPYMGLGPALRGQRKGSECPKGKGVYVYSFCKKESPLTYSGRNALTPTNVFYNYSFDKGRIKSLVSWSLKHYGEFKTINLLEILKKTGFQYATKAGISLGIEDLKIPPKKAALLYEAEEISKKANDQYNRAEITGVERFQRLIDTWHRTSEQLKNEVIDFFESTDVLNPVYMMAFSGARGNISQVRQLVGMRGLMADPKGQIIDYPIRSNFREGLTLTEYIISCYGARKGIVDTALRTANAGYLTRRLVDVAQHVVISNFDCGTSKGVFLSDMKEGNKTIYSLQARLVGRVLARDYTANHTGAPFRWLRNQEISADLAFEITKHYKKVFVRSPLTCETGGAGKKLICQLCYGWSLAQGSLVSIGEAVGIVAAQSIGEPGTQLTMRTFHTGGVFSGDISDQIRAPYNGFVHYFNKIPGTLIRTPEGNMAFLTKIDGFVCVYNSLTDISNAKKFKIPAYTILYYKNNEAVMEKQVIAQISAIAHQQTMRDDSELTVKTKLQGQFFVQNLQIKEKLIGPKPKKQESGSSSYTKPVNRVALSASPGPGEGTKRAGSKRGRKSLKDLKGLPLSVPDPKNYSSAPLLMTKTLASWDWGYAWVLSCQLQKIPFFSHTQDLTLVPKKGDFVDTKSIMAQIQWVLPQHGGHITYFATTANQQNFQTTPASAYNYNVGNLQKSNLKVPNSIVRSIDIKKNLLFLDIQRITYRKTGYFVDNSNYLLFLPTNLKGNNHKHSPWEGNQQSKAFLTVGKEVSRHSKTQVDSLSAKLSAAYKPIKGSFFGIRVFPKKDFLTASKDGQIGLLNFARGFYNMEGSIRVAFPSYLKGQKPDQYKGLKIYGSVPLIHGGKSCKTGPFPLVFPSVGPGHASLAKQVGFSRIEKPSFLRKEEQGKNNKKNKLVIKELPTMVFNPFASKSLKSSGKNRTSFGQRLLFGKDLAYGKSFLKDLLCSGYISAPFTEGDTFGVCNTHSVLQGSAILKNRKLSSASKLNYFIFLNKKSRTKTASTTHPQRAFPFPFPVGQLRGPTSFPLPTYPLTHSPFPSFSKESLGMGKAKGFPLAWGKGKRNKGGIRVQKDLPSKSFMYIKELLGKSLPSSSITANLEKSHCLLQIHNLPTLDNIFNLKQIWFGYGSKYRHAFAHSQAFLWKTRERAASLFPRRYFPASKAYHSGSAHPSYLRKFCNRHSVLQRDWNTAKPAGKYRFAKFFDYIGLAINIKSNLYLVNRKKQRMAQGFISAGLPQISGQFNKQSKLARTVIESKAYIFLNWFSQENTLLKSRKRPYLKKKDIWRCFSLYRSINSPAKTIQNATLSKTENCPYPAIIPATPFGLGFQRKGRACLAQPGGREREGKGKGANWVYKSFYGLNQPYLTEGKETQQFSRREMHQHLPLPVYGGEVPTNLKIQKPIRFDNIVTYSSFTVPFQPEVGKEKERENSASRVGPTLIEWLESRVNKTQKDSSKTPDLPTPIKWYVNTKPRFLPYEFVKKENKPKNTHTNDCVALGPPDSPSGGKGAGLGKGPLGPTKAHIRESGLPFPYGHNKQYNGTQRAPSYGRNHITKKHQGIVYLSFQKLSKYRPCFNSAVGFPVKDPHKTLLQPAKDKQRKSFLHMGFLPTEGAPTKSSKDSIEYTGLCLTPMRKTLFAGASIVRLSKTKLGLCPDLGKKIKILYKVMRSAPSLPPLQVTNLKPTKRSLLTINQAYLFNKQTPSLNPLSKIPNASLLFLACPSLSLRSKESIQEVGIRAREWNKEPKTQFDLVGKSFVVTYSIPWLFDYQFQTVNLNLNQMHSSLGSPLLTNSKNPSLLPQGNGSSHVLSKVLYNCLVQSTLFRAGSVKATLLSQVSKQNLQQISSLNNIVGYLKQVCFEFNLILNFRNYKHGLLSNQGSSKTLGWIPVGKRSPERRTAGREGENTNKTFKDQNPKTIKTTIKVHFENISYALNSLASTSFFSTASGEILGITAKYYNQQPFFKTGQREERLSLGPSVVRKQSGPSVGRKQSGTHSPPMVGFGFNGHWYGPKGPYQNFLQKASSYYQSPLSDLTYNQPKINFFEIQNLYNPVSYVQKQKMQNNKHRCLLLTNKDLLTLRFCNSTNSSLADPVMYLGQQPGALTDIPYKSNKQMPMVQGQAPISKTPSLQIQNSWSSLFLSLSGRARKPFATSIALVQKWKTIFSGWEEGKEISPLTPLALSKSSNIVKMGSFVVRGSYGHSPTSRGFTDNTARAYTIPGQIIHFNSQKVTLRKAQPIFITAKSTFHAFPGDFVEENQEIITLIYQKIKTGDIVQGIPKVEQFFEARTTKRGRLFRDNLPNLLKGLFLKYYVYSLKYMPFLIPLIPPYGRNKGVRGTTEGGHSFFQKESRFTELNGLLSLSLPKEGKGIPSGHSPTKNSNKIHFDSTYLALRWAVKQSFYKIQQIAVDGVLRVYRSQGVSISDKHLEIIVKQMTTKVRIIKGGQTGFFPGELVDLDFVETINSVLIGGAGKKIHYEPVILGITKASLQVDSFLSSASFQQTARILSQSALYNKKDFLKGVKENVILGNLIPAGTGYLVSLD